MINKYPKILTKLIDFYKENREFVIIICCVIYFVIVMPRLYNNYIQEELAIRNMRPEYLLAPGETIDLDSLNADTLKINKKTNIKNNYTDKSDYESKENIRSKEKKSINGESPIQSKKGKYKKLNSVKKIELNSSDTTELKKVYGIGSWYSNLIVKYRKRLGGFYDVSQLREIKMRKGAYETISPQLYADTTQIKKIDLDTISFKNLLRHPYFNYAMVKRVFNLRKSNNHITSNDLLENKIINLNQYCKIKVYCAE